MNIGEIIAGLKADRDRLTRAIHALSNGGGRGGRVGRPAGGREGHGRKGRTMSAAAKKRIGRAMKASWAARKKKGS